MSDEEIAESSQGCENCPTPADCRCEAGNDSCRAGSCECDPSACPCGEDVGRKGRGCLGIAIPPALPGGGWLVAIVALLLVIGAGGGLICTRERGKDKNLPAAAASASSSPTPTPTPTPTPSASPTPSKAPTADIFDPGIFKSDACTPVKAKTTGVELSGSQLECLGVLYGNLDAVKAEKVSSKTGLVVTAGEYFAVFGRANGTPTQVGVGITPAGAATNQGNPDAVDPIGRGGVALAAFGEENGWSMWRLLDATKKFADTGRSVIGFRNGSEFTLLIAGGDLGPEIGNATVLIETFKRDTPEGKKASESDPKGASSLVLKHLFGPVTEEPTALFLIITPRVILER